LISFEHAFRSRWPDWIISLTNWQRYVRAEGPIVKAMIAELAKFSIPKITKYPYFLK
jgi:hypothetical protein